MSKAKSSLEEQHKLARNELRREIETQKAKVELKEVEMNNILAKYPLKRAIESVILIHYNVT